MNIAVFLKTAFFVEHHWWLVLSFEKMLLKHLDAFKLDLEENLFDFCVESIALELKYL